MRLHWLAKRGGVCGEFFGIYSHMFDAMPVPCVMRGSADELWMYKYSSQKAAFSTARGGSITASLASYIDSVKVRVMTSRCCSGVRELKRTA